MASNGDRYRDWKTTYDCLVESKAEIEEHAALFETTFGGMEIVHQSLDVFKEQYNHGYEAGEDTIEPRVEKIDKDLTDIDTAIQKYVADILDVSMQLVEAIEYSKDRTAYYYDLWQKDLKKIQEETQ